MDQLGLHERRQCKRHMVDWAAALMRKEGDSAELFHDRISDVSLCGAGLYADSDIYIEQPLVLLLEMPLVFGRAEKNIAGIECSMCRPIFMQNQGKFRVGLQFVRFHGIGKHLLADILINQE
ncbi:MAG TPA: hypothetical protein VFR06_03745 [Gallionellaceae bacterium]|nr:hypothetical protein [Gallionellaceae bacterium]